MMDTCHTCGGEIAGGADSVHVLPSPFSSFHVEHHMSCYMATAIAAEREACAKIADDSCNDGRCDWSAGWDAASEYIASAIRERGTP